MNKILRLILTIIGTVIFSLIVLGMTATLVLSSLQIDVFGTGYGYHPPSTEYVRSRA